MFTFLVAIAMGFASPHLEKPVARPIAEWLRGFIVVEDREIPVIAFMVALLVAALVAVVLDSDAVLGVALGTVLGVFAARIFAVLKKVIEGKPD